MPLNGRKNPKLTEEQKDAPPEYLRKEENPIPRELRSYKCRICDKVMKAIGHLKNILKISEKFKSWPKNKTKYEFYVHVNKHEAKCVNCNVVYKTWKKLEAHEPYCTRRFGRLVFSINCRLLSKLQFSYICSIRILPDF